MKEDTRKIYCTRLYSFLLKLIKPLSHWNKILYRNPPPKPSSLTDIYLESLLQSSLNNIYWINKEGKIIGCNDQQAKMMGFNSRKDVLGKNITEMGCHCNDIRIMQTGETLLMEEQVCIDNETHYFVSSKSPMLSKEGEIIGVFGISTNITEQKKIAHELEQTLIKAESASRLKNEFISHISHDIRTPLVGMNGLINLLKEKAPAELQNEITAISNAGNELLFLLNGVIDISKIDSGNPDGQTTKPFNLKDIILRLIHLLTPLLQQKKLSLHMFYSKDVPENFMGMSYPVQRSLLNVLSNAIKFTPEGSISIRIERDSNDTGEATIFPVLFSIEDTGIGISAQNSDKIFDRFFRVNPSFQRQFSGCGLGLSIAKKFIEKIGGKIWFDSELGKGSRFYISLPLTRLDNTPLSSSELDKEIIDHIQFLNRKTPSLSAHESATQSDRRILLVEDNILIQKAVASLLTKLNNDVDIAPNGEKALALTQEAMYDLIFMDIGLPDMDGFAVSRQIREFNSEIPIIALTAHLDKESHNTYQDAGINDIITKPLTLEMAKNCLNQYTCKSTALC